MARIRSVKPEFWTDRKLARLSRDARLLYIALWNQADEHGRVHGDSRYLKGHCLPYDDDLSLVAIERLIDDLAEHGRVVRYDHDGDPFLYLPQLAKHQRLEPAKVASRLPEPPLVDAQPQPDPDPAGRDASFPQPGSTSSGSRAHESARRSDEGARVADTSETTVALHVAGSMEQVAGTTSETEPPRSDVEQLCQRLVDRMAANGCKPPIVTTKWRTDARLLLDRDHRPLDEALALIDWCQADTFWRANIGCPGTFRKQYDRLRLRADERPGRSADRFGVGFHDDSRSEPSRAMTGAEWATEGRRSS